ncbi:hypothetical protein [Inquilinus sp. CA228]|uniref:hypothetical protein n=1 Tax=Inquilinus sp. CA228 TaxID=3455609 RepID=UPI003F8D7176
MPGPVTPEFVVNTWNGAWQDNPDVTKLKNGNIVVIWDSPYLEEDVQYAAAQVFRPDGTPVGNEKIPLQSGRPCRTRRQRTAAALRRAEGRIPLARGPGRGARVATD